MIHTRRGFLTRAALGTGVAPLALRAMGEPKEQQTLLEDQILPLFDSLPGDKAVKIFAPAVNGKPEFLLELNSSKLLFVGSAIKTFILGEALRQADSPHVVQTITGTQVALDASVWSIVSPVFNPPNLIGMVTERTALEAMISHSDNTGTDMSLKLVGPDNVRKFIALAGLKNTLAPDSTRSLFAYIFGAKNYKTITWEELLIALQGPVVYSPLNNVETMASTADDLVSYYSRALQGAFFSHTETLNEYRRILSLGDAIYLLPLPLGVSAFVKAGSIDVTGFHCLSVPGAMFFDDRWVYFALTINWYSPEETDPKTAAAFAAAGSQALGAVKDLLST
ncbi:MAG: serine hydrolase [Bryobacteraceae bacterium]